MWLGTDLVFEAFTFDVRETPHGVVQLHGYPYRADASTVIVEMHEDVWQRAFGPIAATELGPGENDEVDRRDRRAVRRPARRGRAARQQLALAGLPHGAHARPGGDGNVVLLGDAAHTAHFSIGSGTKLAMEDALALAACLHERARPGAGAGRLRGASDGRSWSPPSARRKASREWFEDIGHYVHQHPTQFAFNIVTRSRRVTHDNLRLRDPEFVAAHRALVRRGAGAGAADVPAVPAGRAGAAQPGRRLGHGHVPRAGRAARRVPPGPPGRQGARRGRRW